MTKKRLGCLLVCLAMLLSLTACKISINFGPSTDAVPTVSMEDIPAYSGTPYVAINDNQPGFTDDEITAKSFERYGKLDALGRCTVTIASIGRDLMPTEKRGNIGSVKPTGWKIAKYDEVDGKYLYNRCHLIGYQLSGENANECNLITGTRYLNVDGMLPFENLVADYVKETGNHVMYRVIPVFTGDNLVADGVQMEGYSVEDKGDGVCFNVFCYNVQPGIVIDYATGDSHRGNTKQPADKTAASGSYVLNENSKKFHLPDCEGAKSISDKNKSTFTGNRADLLSRGYTPCNTCHP